MVVIFVSHCRKKSIKKTRMVLDSFANRIGDFSWKTIITSKGLETVRKTLAKNTTKNTSVICHYVKNKNYSQIAWVIGNRKKINSDGYFAVNYTKEDFMKSDLESNWKFLPLIKSLVSLSALFHDIGKSSDLFQEKLKNVNKEFKGDPIRHEWISCIILSAFITLNENEGKNWIEELENGNWIDEEIIKFIQEKKSEKNINTILDFKLLSGLKNKSENKENSKRKTRLEIARLLFWIILSHHKLPLLKEKEKEKRASYENDYRNNIKEIFKAINTNWGYSNSYESEYANSNRLEKCFKFKFGIFGDEKSKNNKSKAISFLDKWKNKLRVTSRKLKEQLELKNNLEFLNEINSKNPNGLYKLILYKARLCLMLGDYQFSSLENKNIDSEKSKSSKKEKELDWDNFLYANTYKDSNSKTKPKQELYEHLLGVEKYATKFAHFLPNFENKLKFANFKKPLKKSEKEEFKWQDKVVEKILKYKDTNNSKKENISNQEKKGFFIVNMASTGCGKTIANAKIMQSLSEDSRKLRYTVALGLRTLTLQTGDEYKNKIEGLLEKDIAVLIGSKSISDLYNDSNDNTETNNSEVKNNEDIGSESLDLSYFKDGKSSLLEEDIYYDNEYDDYNPLENIDLDCILKDEKVKKLLYAPILVSTIDYIILSTEIVKGGKYILAVLRLMSSDLIIDEIDDFSIEDLIAISRLVYLTGMLGKKLIISSATINPDLAEALFNVYSKGFKIYALSRENVKNEIVCIWTDEFSSKIQSISDNTLNKSGNCENNKNNLIEEYRSLHRKFIEKRLKNLKEEPARRLAYILKCKEKMQNLEKESQNKDTSHILKCKEKIKNEYFSIIKKEIIKLHNDNNFFYVNQEKKIKVSFGIIRMANINPCIFLSVYLMNKKNKFEYEGENVEVKIMSYHSNQVLLLRHYQEKHLDEVLKRKNNCKDVFENCIIKKHLENCKSKNLIFILVSSPVEEIGRDHDFDWAIIEPSSYRSIIQLAGRVNRHRRKEVENKNIALLQYNFKAFKNFDKPKNSYKPNAYFKNPGFEDKLEKALESHDLEELIEFDSDDQRIDSIARIEKKEKLTKKLVDIEHLVTKRFLAYYKLEDNNEKYEKYKIGPKSLNGYIAESWFLTGMSQYFNRFRRSNFKKTLYYVFCSENKKLYFKEKNEHNELVCIDNVYNIKQKNLYDKKLLGENYKDRMWMTSFREYENLLDLEVNNQENNNTEITDDLNNQNNQKENLSKKYGEISFYCNSSNEEFIYNDYFGIYNKKDSE